MKNSYIEEFENTAPVLAPIMDKEALAKVDAAAKLAPQKKFIPKSDRIKELRAEKDLAAALYNRADGLVKAWDVSDRKKINLQKVLPSFDYEPLDYPGFPNVHPIITAHTSKAMEDAKNFALLMSNTSLTLRSMLLTAYNQIKQDLEMEEKGTTGENGVENYLRRNLSCRILNSVVLPSFREGENVPKTAETDLLVISEHGVFVCEVKNYGNAGQSILITEDGQMKKQDYYGRVLENLPSAIKQNSWHAYAVRSVLASAGLGDVAVWEVTIIANSDVNIINNSKHCVIDMYRFRDMVAKGWGGPSFDDATQSAVYAAIQKERMTERNFPIYAISPARAELESALTLMEQGAHIYVAWRKQVKSAVDSWLRDMESRWVDDHPWSMRREEQEDVELQVFGIRLLVVLPFLVFAAVKDAFWPTVFALFMLLIADCFKAVFRRDNKTCPQSFLGYVFSAFTSCLLSLTGYGLLALIAAHMLL